MSAVQDIQTDRLYTRDHEWAFESSAEVLIGITSFAVAQLGDITLVDITASVGQHLEAKQAFGTVESVKTLSDLFSPVAGIVTRINEQLAEHPELVNADCWNGSWMIAIRPDIQALAANPDLLDAEQYSKHLEALG